MRNVAFRHVIGLAADLLAVYLTGAAHEPAVMDMVKDTLTLDHAASLYRRCVVEELLYCSTSRTSCRGTRSIASSRQPPAH